METKVVGGHNTRWKVLDGAWVVGTCGSEFWCCTECNIMLDNGQHPRLGVEPIRETRLETLRDFTDHMEMVTNEACSALQRAADNMACFYDVHCQHAPIYKVGNKVWLNAQNITTTRLTKKLDHKWLGPYTVDKVIS